MEEDPIRTEIIPDCLLCGNKGRRIYNGLVDRLYSVGGKWSYVRCPDCGFIWLSPRPIPEDQGKIYQDHYFSHKETNFQGIASSPAKKHLKMIVLGSGFGYRHLHPPALFTSAFSRLIMMMPYLNRKVTMNLGALLLPYCEGGRLLDIGCGNGSYLALMKELGWQVAGIETDPVAAEIAGSNLRIPVHTGTLEDAPLDRASFDAVTAIHVLEHVADPLDFIRKACEFLKPGGMLVAVMPNIRSLGHRLFKKNWYKLDPPRHFTAFSPETLRRCIVQTGCLRVRKIRTISRISGKIFRKFVLVKQTGYFSHASEEALKNKSWIIISGRLFSFIERIGNPLFNWGEEIECVLIKN